MEMKSLEKVKYCAGLYPFFAFNSHSATQLVIVAKIAKSQVMTASFGYLVTSLGLLPVKAFSFIIAESGSANAVEVAYFPLYQYHVWSGVLYIAIF